MGKPTTSKKPYRRADAAGLAARRGAILAGLEKGLTPKQIAETVDVTYGRVRETIHNDPSLESLYRASRKTPLELPKVGAITAAIREQSEGFQLWLVQSVPEGTTLADFMVSVALDSFMDETEETPTQIESEST